MSPKFKIGEIVKVYEYYADGYIVRDVYFGVVLGVDTYGHTFGTPSHIYSILPNDDNNRIVRGIQTAEEYAIEEYVG